MATGRTFTTVQAAEYLHVAVETIRRASRDGRLKGVQDGLRPGRPFVFTKEDLDAFRAASLTPIAHQA